MTDSEWTNRFLSAAECFALAKARLSLKTPEALTDPHIIPRHDDQDADPAVLAAIAAMRPIRTAAVLVPIIARAEPTMLFTQRTAQLADHAGEIAFRVARSTQLMRAPQRLSVGATLQRLIWIRQHASELPQNLR
jgi:hypothetical protein